MTVKKQSDFLLSRKEHKNFHSDAEDICNTNKYFIVIGYSYLFKI